MLHQADRAKVTKAHADIDGFATANVFIGTGLLANTPEQRSWYEATQVNDPVFLEMEEPLLDRLAREPGYQRATIPLALFRGVEGAGRAPVAISSAA